MSKDDYIRFRCSTELKKIADNNAQRRELTLTDYMEYLIRKDKDDIMYIHSMYDENGEEIALLEKILETGQAVKMGEDEDYILSKTDKLILNRKIISESKMTLEEYISWLDDGDYIELVKGLEIPKIDAINTFLGEINQPCNDDGVTYAEMIYNAKEPKKQIDQYLNEFLIIYIDFTVSEINAKKEQIRNQTETGKSIVSWN